MSELSKIWIVDFGSQYTQLIARRVREFSVYSEVVLPSITADDILKNKVSALILSGGPSSVNDADAPQITTKIYNLGLPILGICYGLQYTIQSFGGKVQSSDGREYGRSKIHYTKKHPLFKNVAENSTVWMSHGDHIETIPADFDIIALSEKNVPAALAHKTKPIFGLQFHPEVVHSEKGKEILNNFLFEICHLEKNWTAEHFINEETRKIREMVGDNKVLMGVSGGVDSTVMAVLIFRAIGRQCTPVFINNGLLRLNEQTKVMKMLQNDMGLPLETYDYSKTFLKALEGIEEPEQKRKIIGREFIKAFEEITEKHQDYKFLAQGTLYPDVIESRSVKGKSQVIKSHHNVGGLPETMKMELIEPFDSLFKDEVRNIGEKLEIPKDIIQRHPFPGPGLGVRILGEITPEKIAMLQKADDIFIQELHNYDYYNKVWQAFAVFLPVKTVGVMGDQRTYENVIALRSVNSMDGMTADWSHLPHELLSKAANRIVNEVRGINRVVYDITSKPPGTIEWE
ncbi:MAG: glutamine-hydrolyzing GMP synthase [Candidatus Marinimicrobia bacterium]|nr:glutamine-hydrolyzing GMP synthase [Candidatus Neomarinimicrobiota bacterium]